MPRQLQKPLPTAPNSTQSSVPRLPACEPHNQFCQNTSGNVSLPCSKPPHDFPLLKFKQALSALPHINPHSNQSCQLS